MYVFKVNDCRSVRVLKDGVSVFSDGDGYAVHEVVLNFIVHSETERIDDGDSDSGGSGGGSGRGGSGGSGYHKYHYVTHTWLEWLASAPLYYSIDGIFDGQPFVMEEGSRYGSTPETSCSYTNASKRLSLKLSDSVQVLSHNTTYSRASYRMVETRLNIVVE